MVSVPSDTEIVAIPPLPEGAGSVVVSLRLLDAVFAAPHVAFTYLPWTFAPTTTACFHNCGRRGTCLQGTAWDPSAMLVRHGPVCNCTHPGFRGFACGQQVQRPASAVSRQGLAQSAGAGLVLWCQV